MKSIIETLGKHPNNIICENWGSLDDEQNKQWDKWWDEYVPDSGKADTLGGEIMRAFSRIMYRYYNDGDMCGRGYGKETCDASDTYLKSQKLPGYTSLKRIAAREYEEVLCDNEYVVFNFLETHPNVFQEKNDKDSR